MGSGKGLISLHGSWVISYHKLDPGEEQSPPGLAWVESLSFFDVLQVLMVCHDLEWLAD